MALALEASPVEAPEFETARHTRYWLRCLRTMLPTAYTSIDSTLTTFSAFIITALNLLQRSEPGARLKPNEIVDFRRWVLTLQHTNGGFLGNPNLVMPEREAGPASGLGRHQAVDERPQRKDAVEDSSGNLAGTFFALILLAQLVRPVDDSQPEPETAFVEFESPSRTEAFKDVDGAAILNWLRRLQRPDGSFGECLVRGQPHGSRDMRYCYMAAGVRWMLRRPGESTPDIQVDLLRKFIVQGQTFDGGMAEGAAHESHAGYAYCAVAALALLQRAPDDLRAVCDGLRLNDTSFDVGHLERWLASRASHWDEEVGEDKSDLDEPLPHEYLGKASSQIGFDGRQNKIYDSCYTWWVCATLRILGRLDLLDRRKCFDFLVCRMQHQFAGGFGKHVGDRPDIHHSFLGLASCAMLDPDSGLNPIDPMLVIGSDAVEIIVASRDSAFSP